MVIKLKLLVLTIDFFDSTEEYIFICDYSSLRRFLIDTNKMSFLKRYFDVYRPLPISIDGRCFERLALSYIFSFFGRTVFEIPGNYYPFSLCSRTIFDSTCNYYPFSLRSRTLSEATSDILFSNDFIMEHLESFGICLINVKNGDSSNAMFSSPICLSEQLFKSGNWKEYNYFPKKDK